MLFEAGILNHPSFFDCYRKQLHIERAIFRLPRLFRSFFEVMMFLFFGKDART